MILFPPDLLEILPVNAFGCLLALSYLDLPLPLCIRGAVKDLLSSIACPESLHRVFYGPLLRYEQPCDPPSPLTVFFLIQRLAPYGLPLSLPTAYGRTSTPFPPSDPFHLVPLRPDGPNLPQSNHNRVPSTFQPVRTTCPFPSLSPLKFVTSGIHLVARPPLSDLPLYRTEAPEHTPFFRLNPFDENFTRLGIPPFSLFWDRTRET